MNDKNLKAVISALSGAVIVLIVSLLILIFTQQDKPQKRSLLIQPEVAGVETAVVEETSQDKTQATEKNSPEKIFDSLEFDTPANEIAESETVKPKVEDTRQEKLAPLTLEGDSSSIDQLTRVIEEKQSLFEENKPQEEKVSSIEKKPEVTKVEPGSQTDNLSPGGQRLISINENDYSIDSELEKLLRIGPGLFKMSTSEFMQNWLKKTESEMSDEILSSARSTAPLKFLEVSSSETIFSFRKKQLYKISMMIFNKGDQLEIQKNYFESLKKSALASLNKFTGKTAQFKPNAGVSRNNIYFWTNNGVLYKLEFSASDSNKIFTAEYLRITIMKDPGNTNVINIDKVSSNILTESELADMVKRSSNGDVIINGIPMVDQGQKGYCACAALARLLNYFGRDIDQHDIAKLSAATAAGTDPDELKKAIESMSAKLRLNMKVLAKPYLNSERDSDRLKLKINNLVESNPSLDTIEKVYERLAYEDRRYKEFEKNIINSIDRGRPVSWALAIGIVPEPEIPQATGGHMRIITGYNQQLKKIYYTDTWGKGHEKKSMNMASAFYISLAVWEISPR